LSNGGSEWQGDRDRRSAVRSVRRPGDGQAVFIALLERPIADQFGVQPAVPGMVDLLEEDTEEMRAGWNAASAGLDSDRQRR